MRVLKTIEGLQCCLSQWRYASFGEQKESLQLGLVPTMGGLHQGHLSLIERSCRDNDRTIVSIFVNPLQFGPGEDLDRYPRSLDADLAFCRDAGVDGVFIPTPEVIYGQTDPDSTILPQVIPPKAMLQVLCGPFRPGHFEGVALVVTKLLNLVRPDRSYFGRKDAQQLAIIRRLTAELYLPGQVIGCPTVRAADGLALSSRNQYLSPTERTQAIALYRALSLAADRFRQGERQAQTLIEVVQQHLLPLPDLHLHYVELVHPDTLAPLMRVESAGLLALAATLGQTRLIDNVPLRSRQPIIAIDGPAGAGKSTVAARVAQQLGLLYLDSGAMYRAITWLVLEYGIDPEDEVAVAELLHDSRIQLAPGGGEVTSGGAPIRIWVNGQEVTQAIRGQTVTRQVSTIAAQPLVRRTLLYQQQQYGINGGVVMDGRDIGTQVFPQAELKLFLTASVAERARRRQRDLQAQNQPVENLEDLEQAIDERDRKDSTRQVAPLKQAADAIEIQTDGLSIDQVVAKIIQLYHQRLDNIDA